MFELASVYCKDGHGFSVCNDLGVRMAMDSGVHCDLGVRDGDGFFNRICTDLDRGPEIIGRRPLKLKECSYWNLQLSKYLTRGRIYVF